MKNYTLAEVVENVNFTLRYVEKRLEKFTERFATNPAYAFEWGDDAVQHAVKKEILVSLLYLVESMMKNENPEEENIEQLKAHYDDEARRMATRVASSTSKMSNLVEEYKRAYMMEVANFLNGRGFSGL